MKELRKTLRLATYILALPLIATAVVSAYQWTSPQDQPVIGTQVSASNQMVTLTRSHVIKLDKNGYVNGRIWNINPDTKQAGGAQQVTLYFVRSGRIIGQTATDSDGAFSLNGLTPGIYSFIANGANGFATFGLRVVANDDETVADNMLMESTAITQNISAVRELISSEMVNYARTSTISDASTQPKNIISTNRVRLTSSKSLLGRIVSFTRQASDLKGTKVYLLQNGTSVAETTADENGEFEFENVEPGNYGFVAVGENGMAALQIEVTKSGSTTTLVSYNEFQDEVPDTFEVPLVANQDFQTTVQQEEVVFEEPVRFTGGNVGRGVARGTGFGGDRIGTRFGFLGFLGFLGFIDSKTPSPTSPKK